MLRLRVWASSSIATSSTGCGMVSPVGDFIAASTARLARSDFFFSELIVMVRS
jgi:hypothetical protein